MRAGSNFLAVEKNTSSQVLNAWSKNKGLHPKSSVYRQKLLDHKAFMYIQKRENHLTLMIAVVQINHLCSLVCFNTKVIVILWKLGPCVEIFRPVKGTSEGYSMLFSECKCKKCLHRNNMKTFNTFQLSGWFDDTWMTFSLKKVPRERFLSSKNWVLTLCLKKTRGSFILSRLAGGQKSPDA